MADLPSNVCKKKTFRDIIKKDGLLEQQEKFVQRGKYEKEAIAMAGILPEELILTGNMQIRLILMRNIIS